MMTLSTSPLVYLSLPPPDVVESVHQFQGNLGVK